MSEAERQAVLRRNRAMLDALPEDPPPEFDPRESLCRLDLPEFGRVGYCTRRTVPVALALLIKRGDRALASRIVESTLAWQNLDPSAGRGYGNFFWMTNWDTVRDPNAVSFMAPNYGRIWMDYRDRLTPSARSLLEERLPLILEGLVRREAEWGYTNIALLTLGGLFMFCHILKNTKALDHGLARWREWMTQTSQCGIPEFNSPTYAPVDLRGLMLIREFAPDAQVRRQAEEALAFCFADVLLHYRRDMEMLTGAMSRGYLLAETGDIRQGPIGAILHQQFGWPYTQLPLEFLSIPYSDYVAPPDVRRLAEDRTYPMTVHAFARREARSWVRTNYLAERYTVGTLSNAFNTILQVPVFIGFADKAERTTIFVRSEPELTACYATQEESRVLAALCYDFSDAKHRYGPVGPETRNASIQLRMGLADAVRDVLVDGTPWAGSNAALPSGVCMAFRVGSIVVGVVPIAGQVELAGPGPSTSERPVVLARHGRELRLQIDVYRGAEPAEAVSPRHQAAFYIEVSDAADVTGAAMAERLRGIKVRSGVTDGEWKLCVTDPRGALAVGARLDAQPADPEQPGSGGVGRSHPAPGYLLHSDRYADPVGSLFCGAPVPESQ